ncbi:unnamed protein product, partial [Bubo scandiacus]
MLGARGGACAGRRGAAVCSAGERAARGAERGRARRRRRGVSCGASGGRARTEPPSLAPAPAPRRDPAAQRPPPHRGQLSAPSV